MAFLCVVNWTLSPRIASQSSGFIHFSFWIIPSLYTGPGCCTLWGSAFRNICAKFTHWSDKSSYLRWLKVRGRGVNLNCPKPWQWKRVPVLQTEQGSLRWVCTWYTPTQPQLSLTSAAQQFALFFSQTLQTVCWLSVPGCFLCGWLL